jgi:hypothetical protein
MSADRPSSKPQVRALVVLGYVVTVSLLGAGPAQADAASEAAAEALFKQAKTLATAGNYAEACPKFEASQKKSPAAGTLVNLADCYEHEGKITSAWVTYKEASRASAIRKKTEWETLSKSRIAALEPKVPKLVVGPTPMADRADMQIARDGETLARSEWAVAIPVDPGTHTIVATAPGRATFKRTIDVPADGKTFEVRVPVLEETGVALGKGDEGVHDEGGMPTRKTVGLVLGGVGVVGVAIGTVTGILTFGKKSDAAALCTSYPLGCADPAAARALNGEASTMGAVSTISFVFGGVLLAGGTVLFLTAPKNVASLQIAPTFAGSSIGAVAGGRF